MLGYYNYTVFLTYLGMAISFSGILLAINGNLQAALLCLMLSGVCDMFDGKIAATRIRTAQEKQFGIQIDSLSDLICFGVLPAVIVSMQSTGKLSVLCIATLYLLCALIRLAYFNVEEVERQTQTQAARTLYHGLPVTTVALILPAIFCLSFFLPVACDKLCPVALVCMAVAFLTPFKLKKPAKIGKAFLLFFGSIAFLLLIKQGGL